MNATTTAPESSALAIAEPLTYDAAPMQSPGNTALILDPRHMTNMMAVANAMATAKVTVPLHLQGKPGDCLAVVMQATQWGMNPFAVAQKTHIVNGTLGYEAQLVHAVLQATGAIEGTFSYEYQGDNGSLQCRVGAVCAGDKKITWNEWLAVSSVTTKNSPLWKTNPKQQMGYLQVKNWARAFKPGAILGVYTTDELDSVPAKNMGAADVVTAVIPPELVASGQQAADKGMGPYQEFWKKATHMERALLSESSDWHEKFKARATDVDKGRTVDNAPRATSAPTPTPTPTPAPTAASQADPATGETTPPPAEQKQGGAFVPTFANVLEKMVQAHKQGNAMALEIAAEWIDEVSDTGLQQELRAKFEDMKKSLPPTQGASQ